MTSIQLSDGYSMRGNLAIEAVFDNGSRQLLVDDKNLIVKAGRKALVQALLGEGSPKIVDVAFGNGADTTPQADETVLKNRILSLQSGVDYNYTISAILEPAPKLVVSITIPKLATILNSSEISEMALIMNQTSQDNYTTFAIKRFTAIRKSSSFSIVASWTIYL